MSNGKWINHADYLFIGACYRLAGNSVN